MGDYDQLILVTLLWGAELLIPSIKSIKEDNY